MKIDELENYLVENQDDLEWQEAGDRKLRIYSNRWQTMIELSLSSLENITLAQLEKEIVQGKNIEQITRVTGFFSRVSQWNKGKSGELKDRFRIGDLEASQEK